MIEGAGAGVATKAFSSFLGPLAKGLLDLRKNRRERRKAVFDGVIKPAFDTLGDVHQNYLESFHEFLEVCARMDVPNDELVRRFRGYSLKYSGTRQAVRDFARTSEKIKDSFSRPKERVAIDEFTLALARYFDTAVMDGSFSSWFSDFLDMLEVQKRIGRSPWDYDYSGYIAGFKGIEKSFVQQLRDVYQEILPQRWAALSRAYDGLRAEFYV